MKSFDNCTGLALHLGKIALAQHEVEHRALEKCAKIVERRAKEKIGEYQEQTGPFIAWAPLAESTLYGGYANGHYFEGKVQLGYAPPDNPLLREGDMRDSVEHMVVDSAAYVGSNSDIAVYQELGTEKIPPRSFLGGALADELPKVCEIVGTSIVAALVGDGVHGGRMAIEE